MDIVSSINSLLPTIIQAFASIQIARGFRDDFKLYRLKLDIVQLRLSRWGEAAGLPLADDGKGTSTSSPEGVQAKIAASKLETVEDLLSTIKTVLNNAKRESDKMKPKDVDVDESSLFGEEELAPPRFRRLHLRIRHLVEERYHKAATHVSGLKWAMYKKERCEALIAEVSGLIDQLETLVEPQSNLEELTQEECKDMSEHLKTLLEVVGKCDPYLHAAATQAFGDRTSDSISVSATTNHGIMVGVNNKEIRGVTFGSNNTITHQWRGDEV